MAAFRGSLLGDLRRLYYVFTFKLTEANLFSSKERRGIYFKKQGCLLEPKGNTAAKPQEVTGNRNVKATPLLWIFTKTGTIFCHFLVNVKVV